MSVVSTIEQLEAIYGQTNDASTVKVADEAAADKTIVNVGSAEFHARQLVQIIRGRRLDE